MIPENNGKKLSFQTLIKHKIDKPVESKAYNYSPETERQLNNLELDIIEEPWTMDYYTWSNPLVAVPKGLSKIRVCLDARRLNAITVKDKYPMPNVNRVFARMKKSKYFGTIDLNDAFLQTLLEDESKEKTSFIVPVSTSTSMRITIFEASTFTSILIAFLQENCLPTNQIYAF